ncbi:MAG: hypothetical protein LWX83_06205 [Anaerolineae bacterium]|nr:hypothetical protein [Anaerolineae bacterium]
MPKKKTVALPEEDLLLKETRLYSRRRVTLGLSVTLLGFGLFLLGSRPGLFGLDRSPVIGFVQIAIFSIGLAMICLGGYLSLLGLWKNRPTSIAADIGVRMVATGFVVAVFSGMADVFGFGSQVAPEVPYFGPLQAGGVMIGQAIISIGFILLIPYNSRPNKAS